jgi:hypothetical protein
MFGGHRPPYATCSDNWEIIGRAVPAEFGLSKQKDKVT